MIKAEMFKYEHWETLLAPRIVLGIWHVSRLGWGKTASIEQQLIRPSPRL
jgi:phosphatidylglycerol phospholipase C